MADKNKGYPHHSGGSLQTTGRLAGGIRILVGIFLAIMMLMPGPSAGAIASGALSSGAPRPSDDFNRELGHRTASAASSKMNTQSARGTDAIQQPLDPVAPDATTVMVSVSSDPTPPPPGGNNNSYDASLSADAKLLAFDSTASDLVSGITEAQDPKSYFYPQVYLHNLGVDPATTTQITLSNSDATKGASGASEFPALSTDGKWAAWRSCATDLVAGGVATPCAGTNADDYDGSNYQIFLQDLTSHATVLVSKDGAGQPADHASGTFRVHDPDAQKGSKLYYPGYIYTPLAISGDGGLVVYQSTATTLVAGLPAYNPDAPINRIFLYDAAKQTTTLISNPLDLCGAEYPRISGDGHYIVYSSCIALPGSPNNAFQVYLVDRDSHGDGTMVAKISLITIDAQNNTLPGNGQSLYPAISADGSTISFRSSATNLDIGYINTSPNIFMAMRVNGKIGLISRRGQATGNAESTTSALSGDGRFITFGSHANNLVPDDSNAFCGSAGNSDCPDVFMFDRNTYHVKRVSLATAPAGDPDQADQGSYYPAISADGRLIAFDSKADNLTGNAVPGGFSNVFLHDRGTPGTDPDDNAPAIAVDRPTMAYGNKDTTPQTLIVSNVGTGSLAIGGIVINGDPTLFIIDSQSCTATPLGPGSTCKVAVSYHQFYPYGARLSTLMISSNDALIPVLPVPIRGGLGMNIYLGLVMKH